MTGFDLSAKDFAAKTAKESLLQKAPGEPQNVDDYLKSAERIVNAVSGMFDKVIYLREKSQQTLEKAKNMGIQNQEKETPIRKVEYKTVTVAKQVDGEKLKKVVADLIEKVPELPEEFREKKISELPQLYKERKDILDALIITHKDKIQLVMADD